MKTPRSTGARRSGHRSPRPDDAEAAARVLRQFRQVFNAVKRHFQKVERKLGLGGAQVWALNVIREHPGIAVGQLAQVMSIKQSTASNLVKGLVQRELVATQKGGSDRRTVQLQVLPAGARLLKRTPGPYAGVLPMALSTLDSRTLKRLERDLATLLVALDADTAAGSIPLAQM